MFETVVSAALIGLASGAVYALIAIGMSLGFRSAGLDTVPAHAVDALRGKSEMTNDRNLSSGESLNQFDTRAFDLDGFGASFFYEADGIGKAFGDGAVVAAKWHVCYYKSSADGATHSARVVQHLVYGDGEGVFVAQHDHGEGVANEDEVDAGFVDKARCRVVVCGERGDGLALALHFCQRRNGNFCEGLVSGGSIERRGICA